MSELLPCPFCNGGNVDLATLAGKFCVQCSECEASGPWVDKPSLAIEAWTRRAAVQAAQPEAVGWNLTEEQKELLAGLVNSNRIGPKESTAVYVALRMLASAPTPEPMSAPTAEPVADALNTLCKMMHNGEEVEGDDGLAMLVPMDLWNEAQEAIELLVGEDGATPQSAATEPSDAERLDWLEIAAKRQKVELAGSILGTGFEIGEWPSMRVTVKSGTLREVIDAAIRATKGGKL